MNDEIERLRALITAWEDAADGVQYGRRRRSNDAIVALSGPPLPSWWGEAQETHEHVQRTLGPWVPIPLREAVGP